MSYQLKRMPHQNDSNEIIINCKDYYFIKIGTDENLKDFIASELYK
jgi:hypothetical protein